MELLSTFLDVQKNTLPDPKSTKTSSDKAAKLLGLESGEKKSSRSGSKRGGRETSGSSHKHRNKSRAKSMKEVEKKYSKGGSSLSILTFLVAAAVAVLAAWVARRLRTHLQEEGELADFQAVLLSEATQAWIEMMIGWEASRGGGGNLEGGSGGAAGLGDS
ncbi:hypothetical protein TeGR_g11919 [Tetraparma gracilis]|uniref:Uncharacterized protein n=1 Tax=Tetraparma gracilis TaxID=2962635 RepID=A0ABQ6N455_9STRA|nr:hypothetical protein TeGR_g11919 [Tetraparma gracilis]